MKHLIHCALFLLLSPAVLAFGPQEITPDFRGWENTNHAAWRDWSGLRDAGFAATADDPLSTAGSAVVFTQAPVPLEVDPAGNLCNPFGNGFYVGYSVDQSTGEEPIHELVLQVRSASASTAEAILIYSVGPPDSDVAIPVEVTDLAPDLRLFRFTLRARGLGFGALGDVLSATVHLTNVGCLDEVSLDARHRLDGEYETFGCPPHTQATSVFVVGGVDMAGSSYAQDNQLRLTASGMAPGQFGFFLASQNFGHVPCTSGCSTIQGPLCLMGPIARIVPPLVVGPDQRFQATLDLSSIPLQPTTSVVPGSTWHFQAWFRDNNPGPVSNFTRPQSFAFLPGPLPAK